MTSKHIFGEAYRFWRLIGSYAALAFVRGVITDHPDAALAYVRG